MPTASDYIDEVRYPKCGTYLKWLNNLGGYSYFLFGDIYKEDHAIGDNGIMLNPAIDERNFPYFEEEKEEQIVRTIQGRAEDEETKELFKTLTRSNEVYLFTGERAVIATDADWMTIKVVPNTYTFSNKYAPTIFSVQIQLP